MTVTPVVTITTTITTQDGTVFSTGPATTSVTTIEEISTITITTGTTTITFPGVTETTTASSTTTSTITITETQTSCSSGATLKIKRQATSSEVTTQTTSETTATDPPAEITTIITRDGVPGRCICRLVPQTSTLASSSTCSCPATTGTVVFTATSTDTLTAIEITTTPTIIIVTPETTVTTVVTNTVTLSGLETATTTQSSLTITSESIETVFITVTSAVFTCPPSSTTSSSSISSSISSSTSSSVSVSTSISSTISSSTSSSSSVSSTSSRSSTSSAATPEATVPLVCNSTAYLIGTLNNVPTLYNIDLSTSYYFVVNGRVGQGAYTAINAMGYNTLDNYLYAIGSVTTNISAVIRISAVGVTQEIARFTASAAPTAGDVDSNGQFWVMSSGGTVWRHIDLAPGSATYGQTIANGTSTLSGYGVFDIVYLPGQGDYMYSMAAQTGVSSPRLALLRWSLTTHVWSEYRVNTNYAAPNSIIANWGSKNATIWGLAATSGSVIRQALGGSPVTVGTAPGTLSYADGARCALVDD